MKLTLAIFLLLSAPAFAGHHNDYNPFAGMIQDAESSAKRLEARDRGQLFLNVDPDSAPIKELECKGYGMHEGKSAKFYVTLNQEDGLKVGEKTEDGMDSDFDQMPYEKIRRWKEKGRQVVGFPGGLRITKANGEMTLTRPQGWGTSDPKGETINLLCSIDQ